MASKYIAPSGIEVTSNVPVPTSKWWDDPRFHIVWSYASWVTTVLAEKGWKFPRKMFKKFMTR